MTLRLLDPRARAAQPVVPGDGGRLGVYACGPAGPDAAGPAVLRCAVVLDVLTRWARAHGWSVTAVRGVADLDDALLHDAAHGDEPWWALSARRERAAERAADALQVQPPAVAVRASAVVPAVLVLLDALVERGHAYLSAGDVYLAVRTVPGYGTVSGQDLDRLRASGRAVAHGHAGARRDPLDVALWRASAEGEPGWPSPWGTGRPSRAAACAATAAEHLGQHGHVHVGPDDDVLPHQECEAAVATCAGRAGPRWWVRVAPVTGADDPAPGSVRPQAARYLLLSAHHRVPLAWSAEALGAAEAAYGRVEAFVAAASARVGTAAQPVAVPAAVPPAVPGPAWHDFAAALDDDLAVPRALAVVHECVRLGNRLLAEDDGAAVAAVLAEVRAMLAVLGLDPLSPWPDAGGRLLPVVDALVALAVEVREQARATRDWTTADAVRDRLAAAGVVLEDTGRPGAGPGVRWRVEVPT